MANIERVKAVVENIEKQLARQKSQPVANLLSLDMGEWFLETKNVAGDICGTAMCLAGWTAHYAGFKMYQGEDPEFSDITVIRVAAGEGDDPTVEVWAQEFLGLDEDEAEIFYYTDVASVEGLKAALNYVLEEDVFEGVPHYYDY